MVCYDLCMLSIKRGGAVALTAALIVGLGCSGGSGSSTLPPGSNPPGTPPGTTPPGTPPPGSGGPTAKGTPTADPIVATIGAAGGTLESADQRVKLVVPPGALASDVALTMTPITNETPLGLGYAVRLEPDGTTFAVPAKLVFAYEAWARSTAPELLVGATQGADNQWTVAGAPALDTAAKTLTVDVPHFSDWSLSTCAGLTVSNFVLAAGRDEADLAVEEQCEAPAAGALLGRYATTKHPVDWTTTDGQGNPGGPGTLTPNGGTAKLKGTPPGGSERIVRVHAEWRSPSGTKTFTEEVAHANATFTVEGVTVVVSSTPPFLMTQGGKTSVNLADEGGTLAAGVRLSGIGSATTDPDGGFTGNATVIHGQGGDQTSNYTDLYTPTCTQTPKALRLRVTVGHANNARQYITGTVDGTLAIRRETTVECGGGGVENQWDEVPITGAFFAIWMNYDQPLPGNP